MERKYATVGDLIQALQKEHGQRTLSRKLRCSVTSIWNWKHNVYPPKMKLHKQALSTLSRLSLQEIEQIIERTTFSHIHTERAFQRATLRGVGITPYSVRAKEEDGPAFPLEGNEAAFPFVSAPSTHTTFEPTTQNSVPDLTIPGQFLSLTPVKITHNGAVYTLTKE